MISLDDPRLPRLLDLLPKLEEMAAQQSEGTPIEERVTRIEKLILTENREDGFPLVQAMAKDHGINLQPETQQPVNTKPPAPNATAGEAPTPPTPRNENQPNPEPTPATP